MLCDFQPVYDQCGDRHLSLEVYGLFGQQAIMQGLHCLASQMETPPHAAYCNTAARSVLKAGYAVGYETRL